MFITNSFLEQSVCNIQSFLDNSDGCFHLSVDNLDHNDVRSQPPKDQLSHNNRQSLS